MSKVTFAIKLNENILQRLKRFCAEHGTKYSFFVEKAIKEKLAEEELKEDLLDFKMLRKEEPQTISFEDYLRQRNV
ncbi:MAG: hypothetical protein U9R52_03280 [Candidatus Omnitrophota bacterium]|nr:hypothetical protein [Candidatus Omnitrophota bacterium]